MNMLIETLGMVSSSPLSWGGVGAMLLFAAYSLVVWYRCPHIAGTASVNLADAQSRLDKPFAAGPRYFFMMVLGIASMLTGLAMIANDFLPVKGFLIVVAGVFVVQITPLRLRLRESYDRVIAAECEGPEAVEVARDRLRDVHLSNIVVNLFIAIALASALLIF
ncbi:MAG: hypothetical protein AAF074_20175 [Pseudomonadota bacterium]